VASEARTSITIALSLGTSDPASARTLGWALNAESLRVREEFSMRSATDIRDHLRAFLDRERSARFARLHRDLWPQHAPLVGDWPSMMGGRAREYRIFGRLQRLAAEEGFEAGYDTALDGRLKQEGFTFPERGAIKRRIENGYLRDLGRPDETGRFTPPRAYLQAMLAAMGEPLTESGITKCLRRLAAISALVSQEFSEIYDEAKLDPHEARTKLSAMRAKGEIPTDELGWAKSDFDGADRFEWGNFDVRATTSESNAVENKDGATASIKDVQDPSFVAERGASEADHSSTPVPVSYPSKTTMPEAVTANDIPPAPSAGNWRDGVEKPQEQNADSAQKSASIEAYQTDSQTGKTTNSLREITERLIAHKGQTWDRKTADQHRAVAKLLGDTAGTDDLRHIKHDHLVSYIQNLSNLPKSYGKSARDKDRSIWDLVARGTEMRTAEQGEKVGLSPPTINRHITQLSTIAKYCRGHERPIGHVELLSDFRLIDPERDGEKRSAFEHDDVRKLFFHTIWTSGVSTNDALKVATNQEIFAAVYWLPLLGYYTCGRLSELVYLELGDIDPKEQSLQIRPTTRRRLKNRVSRRTIPIHPELIRLGFLDFVRNKVGSPHDLIFSDIAQLGDKTPLSNLFDKRWTVVLDEAVPTAREEEKTFHSFRHFGNTEMIKQLVIDPIRETTLGHEGKTVNSRIYKKGLRAADLKTAIAAIPDLTQILHPHDWKLICSALERKSETVCSESRKRRGPACKTPRIQRGPVRGDRSHLRTLNGKV